jgi:short-subunit dehydrogenase
MRLKGTKVFLTGGAGGIGQLVARNLLKGGAKLTVLDRSEGLPYEAEFIKGDLSTIQGINAAGAAIAATEPDILINLAGVQHFGPLDAQSDEHLELTYLVNLVAPALLTKDVLPGMKARGRGQIVNIGSIFGSIGFANFVTYSSAKAGLRTFSEALRRELDGSSIIVTYIAPRAVKTGLSNGSAMMDYAKITSMNMDKPEYTARKIVSAIKGSRKDVYIGFPESLFVRVNSLLPRVVDAALAKNDRKAKFLFEPTS